MIKHENPGTVLTEKKSGGIEYACARYGLGSQTMRRVAEDAHAVVRIGKRVLILFDKIDRYMDELSEKEVKYHDEAEQQAPD